MKKITALVLILCLSAFVVISCEKTENVIENKEPNFKEGYFHYNALSYKEQLLYDAVLNSVKDEKSEINPKYSYNGEEFNNIIDALAYDNPLLFYVDWELTEYEVGSEKLKMEIYFNKYKDKKSEVAQKIEEIIGKLGLKSVDVSDIDKQIAIHDYIVETFTPAAESYEELNLSTALSGGAANSYIYSSLFKILMNEAGIECQIIGGNVQNNRHAWNISVIDGKSCFTDVFFNDPNIDFLGNPVFHAYFNLSYEKISHDHNFNKAHLFESMNDAVSYYQYKKIYAENEKTLSNILYREITTALEQGKDAFEIFCDMSDTVFSDVIYEVIDKINGENDNVLKRQYRAFNESNTSNARFIQIFKNY